jgi:hypothetical protein
MGKDLQISVATVVMFTTTITAVTVAVACRRVQSHTGASIIGRKEIALGVKGGQKGNLTQKSNKVT